MSETLIVNENSSVRSREAVNIFVKAVFAQKALTGIYDELARALWERPHFHQNHGTLCQGLQQILHAQLSGASNKSEFLRLLGMVYEHEHAAQLNRSAYIPNSRENPLSVWWPNPAEEKHTWTGNPRSIFDEIPLGKKSQFIDRETRIGSAGSCFAMEIYHRLRADGFNYVVTEENEVSSAKWGTIFNIPSFRQLIEKSFGLRELPRLLWTKETSSGIEYRDPFREEISFPSVEAYEADYDEHTKAARQALTDVDVFVITLGLNEVWYLRSHPGVVFSRNPWNFSPYLVERRVLSFEENLSELQRMLDVWRIYNPNLKLIVSVSPVPLMATFQEDTHVISATCYAKSMLRVVAQEFANRNEDVFYFPSFETVMYCTENPWQEDQRHVARHAVANVMRLFEQMFVRPEAHRVQEAGGQLPTYLAMFETVSRDVIRETLSVYLEAFTEKDPVSLVVWVSPGEHPQDVQETAFFQKIEEVLCDLGRTPENIPDIQILVVDWPDVLSSSMVFQGILGTSHDLMKRTRLQSLECFQKAGDLREHWAQQQELQVMKAIVGDLQTVFAQYPPREKAFYEQQLSILEQGFRHHIRSGGAFSQQSYESMRWINFGSQGRLKYAFQAAMKDIYPPKYASSPEGLLSKYSAKVRQEIQDVVAQDGYEILPCKLPQSWVEQIYMQSLNIPAKPVPSPDSRDALIKYDAKDPVAQTYWIPEQDTLRIPEIQLLLSDESILNFVREYMGFEPILGHVGLWWTAQYKEEACSTSAQLFHRDMDRISFFHLFFYLTDVTEQSGAHAYVQASHRDPEPLMCRDGRLSDDEIVQVYGQEKVKTLTGDAGTIIAGETFSLHKGTPVQEGERLMLELVFCSSLFGAKHENQTFLQSELNSNFLQMIQDNPRVFRRFLISD